MNPVSAALDDLAAQLAAALADIERRETSGRGPVSQGYARGYQDGLKGALAETRNQARHHRELERMAASS